MVVFDTAPAAHTLRLLDLPFDYARQVETMVSSDEKFALPLLREATEVLRLVSHYTTAPHP